MDNEEIDKLLAAEDEHLNKLHQRVKDSMREEELIITNLLHPPKEILTPGQTLSDKVARFGGTRSIVGGTRNIHLKQIGSSTCLYYK